MGGREAAHTHEEPTMFDLLVAFAIYAAVGVAFTAIGNHLSR